MEAAIALLHKAKGDEAHELKILKLPLRKSEHLTTNQINLLTAYIATNKEALALERSAVQLPLSRYSIDLNNAYATKLPHLEGIKELSQLEQYVAFLGPGDSGSNIVTCVESQLGLARTLEWEPVLLSQMVRIRCLRGAGITVERALSAGEISEQNLKKLTADFATIDQTGFVVRGLIGERPSGISIFRMSEAEALRYGDDQDYSKADSLPPGPPVPGPQPQVWRLTGFFDRDLSFYLDAMATNIAYARKSPPESLQNAKYLESPNTRMEHGFYLFSRIILPSMARAIKKEVIALSYIRDTEAALAVDLYRQKNGSLPESLAAAGVNLIDPFDGKPLRYHKLPDRGYVVYSVGPDKQDDNGKERPDRGFKESDRYDLTFVVDR